MKFIIFFIFLNSVLGLSECRERFFSGPFYETDEVKVYDKIRSHEAFLIVFKKTGKKQFYPFPLDQFYAGYCFDIIEDNLFILGWGHSDEAVQDSAIFDMRNNELKLSYATLSSDPFNHYVAFETMTKLDGKPYLFTLNSSGQLRTHRISDILSQTVNEIEYPEEGIDYPAVPSTSHGQIE